MFKIKLFKVMFERNIMTRACYTRARVMEGTLKNSAYKIYEI